MCIRDRHVFMYRGYEVESEGNPFSHGILRGAVDITGATVPNYHYEDLCRLYEMYSPVSYTHLDVYKRQG